QDVLGEGKWPVTGLLLGCSAALAFAFQRVRPTRGWALVTTSVLFFAFAGMLVTASNVRLAVNLSAGASRDDLAWIDEAVGPAHRVAIVWSGSSERTTSERSALRQAVFFNRSIGGIYDLGDPLVAGYPSIQAARRDGDVIVAGGRPVHTRYVVADRSLHV